MAIDSASLVMELSRIRAAPYSAPLIEDKRCGLSRNANGRRLNRCDGVANGWLRRNSLRHDALRSELRSEASLELRFPAKRGEILSPALLPIPIGVVKITYLGGCRSGRSLTRAPVRGPRKLGRNDSPEAAARNPRWRGGAWLSRLETISAPVEGGRGCYTRDGEKSCESEVYSPRGVYHPRWGEKLRIGGLFSTRGVSPAMGRKASIRALTSTRGVPPAIGRKASILASSFVPRRRSYMVFPFCKASGTMPPILFLLSRGFSDMDAIRTKADFYRLYEAGALGNKPRTWGSVAGVVGSGYGGSVTVRVKVPSYQGMKRHRVAAGDLAGVVDGLMRESGLGSEAFAFNESLPDERLVMQGEVVRGAGGLCLSWSVERGLVMRDAMLGARHSEGVSALVLLRWAMDAASLENLEALLDRWDDHAVEFASYEIPVGVLGWNTVFFEARGY